jgi:hypothetical protein
MTRASFYNLIITTALIAPISAFAAHTPSHKVKKVVKPTGISRTVLSFTELNIGGNFQLTVNGNQPQQVLIQANATTAKCVLTNVNGTTLYIHQSSAPQCQSIKTIKLMVNVPKLNGIMAHGQNITNLNNIKTKTFLSYTSGRSHLTISGQTNSFNSVLSGEASVDAHAFKTQGALVSASGNSEMQLQTNGNLFVRASGNSTITYTGKPKHITKSLSGTSSVTQSS